MNNPFPAYDGEPSRGVLGKTDSVAWAAMQNVMFTHAAYRDTSIALAEARRKGRVGTSLALCEDLLTAEQQALHAQQMCVRLAGESAMTEAAYVTAAKEVAV